MFEIVPLHFHVITLAFFSAHSSNASEHFLTLQFAGSFLVEEFTLMNEICISVS